MRTFFGPRWAKCISAVALVLANSVALSLWALLMLRFVAPRPFRDFPLIAHVIIACLLSLAVLVADFILGYVLPFRLDVLDQGLVCHCLLGRREIGWSNIESIRPTLWLSYYRPLVRGARMLHPLVLRVRSRSGLASFVILHSFEPYEEEIAQLVNEGLARAQA